MSDFLDTGRHFYPPNLSLRAREREFLYGHVSATLASRAQGIGQESTLPPV